MPETDNQKEKTNSRHLPPAALSEKLAEEMMENLEETLAAIGQDLEKANSFLAGYDTFDQLEGNTNPIAKAIVEVCAQHTELDTIFSEAFSILKVLINNRTRQNQSHSALKWFLHKLGS